MLPSQIRTNLPTMPGETVLILSGDTVVAALLGALIETLGYQVRFAETPESPDNAIRRARPRVCLIDCADPAACTDELFGRARMRGISVLIFGRPAVLDRVRALALEHSIDLLLMPADAAVLDAALRRAVGNTA